MTWVERDYPGTPDALRILSFLLLNEEGRRKLQHFSYADHYLSACIRSQREWLKNTYEVTAKNREFSGFLYLIRLCRKQQRYAINEISKFYENSEASRSESAEYYVASLQVLISLHRSLSDEEQNELVATICSLRDCDEFASFANTVSISWLLDYTSRKCKHMDKAVTALSKLVHKSDPSQPIFDTAMNKLLVLLNTLSANSKKNFNNSTAYKELISAYIAILAPRTWHVMNNKTIIHDMAEWLEKDIIVDSELPKYLEIIAALAQLEDVRKILARPSYITALCELLRRKSSGQRNCKSKVYEIVQYISRYSESKDKDKNEAKDAIRTLRKELYTYIGDDISELQHKEMVEALANTMTSSEAAEEALKKGFIFAILSFKAETKEDMFNLLKLLNRSISSKEVCREVVEKHKKEIIELYRHELMKELVKNEIDVVIQNLAYLLQEPTFFLQLLKETSLFKEWTAFLDTAVEEDELYISKISKSLLTMAENPDCQLLVMEWFLPKYLQLLNRFTKAHLQYVLLQFINDLLIINPIPYSEGGIGRYIKEIKNTVGSDKPELASLTVWCFSVFFELNYSKEYTDFYTELGILSYIAEMAEHSYIEVSGMVTVASGELGEGFRVCAEEQKLQSHVFGEVHAAANGRAAGKGRLQKPLKTHLHALHHRPLQGQRRLHQRTLTFTGRICFWGTRHLARSSLAISTTRARRKSRGTTMTATA